MCWPTFGMVFNYSFIRENDQKEWQSLGIFSTVKALFGEVCWKWNFHRQLKGRVRIMRAKGCILMENFLTFQFSRDLRNLKNPFYQGYPSGPLPTIKKT